ncbi:MAG: UDP-N-acetylmuramate dehydrogenase [Bacteroidales bacterium]|nr:UDP-N-acetylmuramate dehydrogenase [Bacteroidales bacterium]
MTIEHGVSLKKYNTFGIEATAKDYVAIRSHDDLMQLLQSGLLLKEPFLILGGGSNVVFTRDFDGVVVRMENAAVRFGRMGDDIVVAAEAGKVMDELVRECAAKGAYGLENLAAIPGTVGASAVQNVGAYGLEAKDVILCVQAYEIASGKSRTFMNEDCQFGYRQSIFKGELKDKYIIESVMYRLTPTFEPKLGYKALADALAGKDCPTAAEVIDVITQVRWSKLPRPEEKGSAGSFFKNPVVPINVYERIVKDYPGLVAFDAEAGKKKLSAGWMIEQCGWKGRNLGHAGVYEKQALVLVNADGEARGGDVVELAGAVVSDVYQRFGVLLVPEAIIV